MRRFFFRVAATRRFFSRRKKTARRQAKKKPPFASHFPDIARPVGGYRGGVPPDLKINKGGPWGGSRAGLFFFGLIIILCVFFFPVKSWCFFFRVEIVVLFCGRGNRRVSLFFSCEVCFFFFRCAFFFLSARSIYAVCVLFFC